jgi:hypothetical protein
MSRSLLPRDYEVELLASAARTTAAEGTSAAQYNHDAHGLILTINVTAITATPVLTPQIQFSPDGGTTWLPYWIAAATIATAVRVNYLLYPGLLSTVLGNSGATGILESVNLPLPRIWRLIVNVADTDSATYSASAHLL